jgi:hypothetical protein
MKVGERHRYSERDGYVCIVEILKIKEDYSTDIYIIQNIKESNYELGYHSFSTNLGVWELLEGQDKPL